MSEGLNKVILIGNLGADPESRFTSSGGMVLNLRLATNESWFDKETQSRKERTEWHSVVVFGARAEGLSKVLRKGGQICVEGRLQTTNWEKDGQKHYRTEIVANEVLLLGAKPVDVPAPRAAHAAVVPVAPTPPRAATRAPF